MAQLKEVLANLDKKLEKYDDKPNTFYGKVSTVSKAISKATKMPRSQIIGGALAAFCVIFFWILGMAFLATFVGTVYPTYKSFKAIESREKDDDTKWLTYWVIFATLQNLEFFSAYIVFWIPFYQPLRMALLVWCMLPIPANGSKVLYDQVIKKFFLKHQVDIDGLASKAAKAAEAAAEAVKDE